MVLAVTLTVSAWVWAQPQGWVINSRDYLSEEDQIGALWELDLSSGDARLEGRSRIQRHLDIESLALNSDSLLFGVDDDTNTLLRIGTTSGNAIAVDQQEGNLRLPPGNHDFGMTFTCDGRLLMSTDSESLGPALYEVDSETGEAERIGDLGVPIVDMASLGGQVYGIGRGMATATNSAVPNLYRIDPDTGSASLVGPLGEQADLYNKAGLAADVDGTLWAVTDRRDRSDRGDSRSSQVLRIDPLTGYAERVTEVTSTENGGDLIGVESLAIAPPGECGRGMAGAGSIPVPTLSEPALWTLILLVLALAAVPLRRLGAN